LIAGINPRHLCIICPSDFTFGQLETVKKANVGMVVGHQSEAGSGAHNCYNSEFASNRRAIRQTLLDSRQDFDKTDASELLLPSK
jgi:hypothetical protein